MPVYVIAEVDVTNPAAMASEFSAKNQPVVRAAGGRYLAAGGETLALEGEPPKRIVIHVWNTMDEVNAWWNSAASKTLREVGARYGKFRVFAVEGLAQ
jgi:uncharacterized protein (DUF1330 family)